MITLSDPCSGSLNESKGHDQSDEPLAMRNLTEPQKEQLGVLLEQFLTAFEIGIPPTVDSLTRNCPELRDALQACISGLEKLHRLAGGESATSADLKDDTRILGEFELHEEIGRGGMGVVYRGTQISLRRTVAIKILPYSAVLDARRLTRFRQEAEAAASMQHPNIVPVFSVGCERGIHFYAMQYIDGCSMGELIARKDSGSESQTDWRTSVDQVIQVAEGLYAAHQLGIIHRDIKPSNLLVDQNGKVWISDFGLARIQNDVSLTHSGDVIGTMKYMSPEQARGDSAVVDGRTDVYSLGATLYELLAGVPARDGADAASIMRQIDEDSPISLRKHCGELPADLDTVVAQAMAGSRDDRYESAKEFADDLRRVLAGEPTFARPPTLLDHAGRLASKYRGAVATVMIFVILALAGFAVSNTRLAAEKVVSESNATLAKKNEAIAREAIDRLGTQMAELLGDIPAANSVRHRLLSETLAYYQRLAQESDSHGPLNRERQLDLAITHGKIGSFQSELGRNADAKSALERSERLYEELAQEFPSDSALQLQWSISQNNLAEAFAELGEFDLAAEWFTKAITTQRDFQTLQYDPAVSELATTLNNLGRMLAESENVKEAESVYQRGIDLLNDSPDHADLRATIQSNLAGLLVRSDAARATEIARQSLATQLDKLEADSGDAKVATQVVLTLNTLATAQATQSRHRDAIESLRRAIEISGQLRRRWPEQASYRRDLGISLNQLGLCLSALGRSDQAANAFEQASKHARALLKVYGSDAELHSMLGGTLNNLGFLKQKLGDRPSARSLYAEAIEQQQFAVHRTSLKLGANLVRRFVAELGRVSSTFVDL